MLTMNRRSFLKRSLAAAGALAATSAAVHARAAGSNERIRVAVAGLNGRGESHIGSFAGMEDVDVVCLIDPDTRTFKPRLEQLEKKGRSRPDAVQDVRRALERKDIDAVSIATTNHWHAPITIWACQAGKDVYVEKPLSHNVREGRVAVEAARKHGRIVQHGTQSRASGSWKKVAAVIRSGKLGKLLVSRGLCYKPRGSIGTKTPMPAPAEIDFDLWLGPAPRQAYHENLVHYNWHWFWDFGNGDIGNQGVHQMDIARWCIPGATLPSSAVSLGGRFGYSDQGQTPNTQIALFDYGETKLVFEVRGLQTKPFHGERSGNVFHLEEGIIAGNKFFPKGKDSPEPLPEVEETAERRPGDHFRNFIEAVRTRKPSDLHADVLEGHYSSALCHLANISYRLGNEVALQPRAGALGGDSLMEEALGRFEEHLAKENGLKLEEMKLRLGRKLIIDPGAETIPGDPEAAKLLTREYRAPYLVPEKLA